MMLFMCEKLYLKETNFWMDRCKNCFYLLHRTFHPFWLKAFGSAVVFWLCFNTWSCMGSHFHSTHPPSPPTVPPVLCCHSQCFMFDCDWYLLTKGKSSIIKLTECAFCWRKCLLQRKEPLLCSLVLQSRRFYFSIENVHYGCLVKK